MFSHLVTQQSWYLHPGSLATVSSLIITLPNQLECRMGVVRTKWNDKDKKSVPKKETVINNLRGAQSAPSQLLHTSCSIVGQVHGDIHPEDLTGQQQPWDTLAPADPGLEFSGHAEDLGSGPLGFLPGPPSDSINPTPVKLSQGSFTCILDNAVSDAH